MNNKCLLKTSDNLRHDTARNDGDAVLVEVAEIAVMRCLENRASLLASLHHPTVIWRSVVRMGFALLVKATVVKPLIDEVPEKEHKQTAPRVMPMEKAEA